MRDPSPRRLRPRVALALQGGGAHGAYGWGALERLLEEEIEIVAVSGASAGALNGAALVSGLAAEGIEGARAALARLWEANARLSPLRLFDQPWAGALIEPWLRQSLEWSKLASRYVAPFSPGLRDMRALRQVVSESIDLDALYLPNAIPLHVSATRVATGAARLFANDAIDLDALMASACLPELFAAVTIDGEEYWDGGFSANPALEPLIGGAAAATDVLIVQITPFAVEEVGTSLGSIVRRMSDIGFNACLLRDLKALTDIQAIARRVRSDDPVLQTLAATNLHLMEPAAALGMRGGASKLDTRRTPLEELRALGRESADKWLAAHAHELGRTSTLTELPEGLDG